ncbi:hypothetical protein WN943_027072 [Citrus x changshan-huyou]
MRSVCPSICGWKLVENLRSVPNILKSSVQKRPVNRGSRLLTMLLGTSQSFTMCLTNRRAASSTLQSTGAAMNVAYLLYRSTTTMMLPQPSDLGSDVMKSMETLSHGLVASGSLMIHLVLLTHKTSSHICLDVVPHVRPKYEA